VLPLVGHPLVLKASLLICSSPPLKPHFLCLRLYQLKSSSAAHRLKDHFGKDRGIHFRRLSIILTKDIATLAMIVSLELLGMLKSHLNQQLLCCNLVFAFEMVSLCSVVYPVDHKRVCSPSKVASPFPSMSYTRNYYGYQSGGYNTGASDDSGGNEGNSRDSIYLHTSL
jgi:hypothetical protein